jgi:hypothetical protein
MIHKDNVDDVVANQNYFYNSNLYTNYQLVFEKKISQLNKHYNINNIIIFGEKNVI